MDVRSGRPLVRLPFCLARGVDTGGVLGDAGRASPGVSGGLGVFKAPLTASLLSSGVTWIFEPSGSLESTMMLTCSSHTSDLGRDSGFSISGVCETLILLST